MTKPQAGMEGECDSGEGYLTTIFNLQSALAAKEAELGAAFELGKADMLKTLSDEIDAMGCDKAMFSVARLMKREDKIRAALAKSAKPEESGNV